MGKRHMGELNFGYMNAPPPFWEIANAVDLTQWTWTAPTSFETRHSPLDAVGSRPSIAPLQSWLMAAPNPSSALSLDGLMPDMVAMEAVAPVISSDGVRTMDWTTTPPSRRILSEPGNDIFSDVDALTERGLRAMLSKGSGRGTSGGFITLQTFCKDLTTAIAHGNISCDNLRELLGRLTDETYDWLSMPDCTVSSKDASSLLVQVYTAVVDGLCMDNGMRAEGGARTQHFEQYHSVYAMLLDRFALLDINSLRLFQRTMENIPADCLWRCKDEIASNIYAFMAALCRPATTSCPTIKAKGRQGIIRQVNKMAGCLKGFDSEITSHRDILESVTERFIVEQGTGFSQDAITRFELGRFCWLHLLSRLPQLRIEYLARVCSLLDTSSHSMPLKQRQICEIFLARINSRYSVKHMTAIYESLKTSLDSACYATVSGKLWKTGQQRYVKILADLLQLIGRQQDIRHVVRGLRSLVQNESKPLANLAVGLGHPQLALWVYIRYHQSRWKSKKFWNTAFAQETLDKLLESRELKSEKILDALRIYPNRQQRLAQKQHYPLSTESVQRFGQASVTQRPKHSMLPQRRVQQTERIASALARARHMSNRMALARISRCIEFLQTHHTPIPPKVLHALFHIVTRDLAVGNPGRTSRLKWSLGLLLKETNTNDVLEVGAALQKWRKLLYPIK